MMRIHTVALEASDTDLDGFASWMDAQVAEACASLERDGHEVVAISPVPLRTSRDVSEDHRENWVVEHGILAVITYRTSRN